MPTDGHKIIIKADKTPIGEHARRFNVATIDEVAIVVVGEQFRSRDIVLYRRNEQLQRISELHRCYDALQYPILFWRGRPLSYQHTNDKSNNWSKINENRQCDEFLFVSIDDSPSRKQFYFAMQSTFASIYRRYVRQN
ncbi:uncharacterized protein LOC128860939 [Anastrepha ludens]|uniref:uncharacterized protein LOC128860939 n=1 Tax=Anastrepha ludens TaxID=28586 RepID=UPI0023B158FA|nr:uncharacterized protein LOC128860939 [Anastrepha ludens]